MAGVRAVRAGPRRGPGRPPKADAAATKQAILEAAVDCFADGGFDGTTSVAVAECAGVTATTVYHHFHDKRGLYVAAYRYSLELAWRAFQVAVDEAASASTVDQVMAMLRTAADIIETRPSLTLLALRAQTDDVRSEVRLPVVDETFAAVERNAIERGELRSKDTPRFRAVVEMFLWGLSVNVWRDPTRRDDCLEGLEGVLRHTLLAGLRRGR